MTIIDFLGYTGALLIGIILGLVGGGGSILTVPVFVYVLGIGPVIATAYSLFVVGISAVVGAWQNYRKDLVDVRTAIIFAIPAFAAVYATRRFLMPAIPDHLFQLGNFTMTKDIGIMIFFALIMLLASISMIRSNGNHDETESEIRYNYPLILLEGIMVGVLTGIVGAGGGFLIIPALVLLARLPMKKAVGTSLLIIAFKSLIGFLGDIQVLKIEWSFLLIFSLFAIAGIILGTYISNFINGAKLKKGFGWFILFMGIFIIVMELFIQDNVTSVTH